MANTYSNSVIIGAPRHHVVDYLIDISIGDTRFNMAKLFPEQFAAEDKSGEEGWTSEWCCDTTGSPTLPSIEHYDRWDDTTLLVYETEYGPNTGTLERLHQLTGWFIEHRSEEPLLDDDIWVMTCENGKCSYDTLEPEALTIPDELPALYGDLFTLEEYQALVRNSRLPDSRRHAVLQLVSPKGAATETLVCPVAIKPDEPEWIYALVIFPDHPKYPTVALADIKVWTLKRWKLARYDGWQPTGDNIAEYTEHSRMFFK